MGSRTSGHASLLNQFQPLLFNQRTRTLLCQYTACTEKIMPLSNDARLERTAEPLCFLECHSAYHTPRLFHKHTSEGHANKPHVPDIKAQIHEISTLVETVRYLPCIRRNTGIVRPSFFRICQKVMLLNQFSAHVVLSCRNFNSDLESNRIHPRMTTKYNYHAK